MNIYKNAILMIAAISLNLSLNAQQPEPAKITEVNIITKSGTFKRPVCYAYGTEIDIAYEELSSDALASYEDTEKIAKIQSENESILHNPLVVLKQTTNPDGVNLRAVKDLKTNNIVLTCAMDFDAHRDADKDFFIGHEMGHLQYKFKVKNGELITTKESKIKKIKTYNNHADKSLLLVASGLFMAQKCSNHKIKSEYDVGKLAASAVIGLGIGLYVMSRWNGHKTAKPLHEEELACDDFAISLGKTLQDKINIAQGGIQHFEKWHTGFFTEFIGNYILTSTHPSNTYRAYRYRRTIIEQQKLLKSSKVKDANS